MSLGEYAALVISGAIALEDALFIVANRARVMTEQCALGSSGMAACQLSPSKADALIAGNASMSRLSVACRNSEDACVISGPLTQLDVFQTMSSKQGIKSKRLAVPYGFHSDAMDPIVMALRELGKSVVWRTPTIPVASNVSGRLLIPKDFGPDYFAIHARQPVRFSDIAQSLQRIGALDGAVWIEVGPHPTTLPMLQRVPNTTCQLFPSMQKEKDSWTLLYNILSYFYRNRDDINWRSIFEPDMKMLDLPGHPLVNTPFSVPYRESTPVALSSEQDMALYTHTGFTLLPRRLTYDSTPENTSCVFETTMAVLGRHIAGHNVGGTAICPASVFFELALEAGRATVQLDSDCLLIGQDISFANPLIYDSNNSSQPIRVQLVQPKTQSGSASDIRVTITTIQHDKEIHCCSTTLSIKDYSEVRRSLVKDGALANRQRQHFSHGNTVHSTFHKKLLYETIFTRVVTYSAEYQSLVTFSILGSSDEGFGSFKLPSTSHKDRCLIPPVFTDTLLHAAGFAANLSVSSGEICICSHIGSVEILDDTNFDNDFTIYCSLFDNANGSILADAIVLDFTGAACATIRGIEFKKLRLTSFQRLLQNAAIGPTKTISHPAIAPRPSIITDQHPATALTKPQPLTVDTRARVRDTVSNILEEVYGSNEINPTLSLESLGIDSLMQIEITSKLRDFFPETNMSPNDLMECESLEALENYIISAISTPALTLSGNVTPELSSPESNDGACAQVRDPMIELIGQVYGSPELDYSKSPGSLGNDPLTQFGNATSLETPATNFDHHNLLQQDIIQVVEDTLERKVQPKQNHNDNAQHFASERVSSTTNGEVTQTSVSRTVVKSSKRNPLLLHASESPNLPIYLIHDGSGQVGMYAKLCKPDRKVLGFFDPDFPRKPLQTASLEQMASRYASCLSASGIHELIIGGKSLTCQLLIND